MRAARATMHERKRRFTIEDARDRLLRHDAELAGKLVTLPAPLAEAPSPTIRSIRERPAAPVVSGEALEAVARPAPPSSPARRPVEDKIAEADSLIAAAQRGGDVDPERLRWARAYAAGSEYRTAKVMAAHFGPRTADPAHAADQASRSSTGGKSA